MYRQGNDETGAFGYETTPIRWQTSPTKTEKPFLTETKLAVFGLTVSILVIASKLYFANYEYIKKSLIGHRLITYEVIVEDGQVMFTHAWISFVKYSNFWLPALCGFIITYLTSIVVYLDSHVPGVQPPSPFSPNKFKITSGHSFHLNYVFAVAAGAMVASYMYWKQVAIQY